MDSVRFNSLHSPLSCHVHILVYCLRTIRYGLGRCFWGERYTHTSSDKGSSRQPWPLCCPTHPYSQPPPPHQHQPLPLTHPIGPRCACGITCHVHDLPYIHLDYPSQVLSRHSDPRPCHSASLPDPISSNHPRNFMPFIASSAYGMPLIATAAQSSVLILVRTEAGPFKLLLMQRPHQIQPVSPRPRHDRDQQASSGSKHETMRAQTIHDLLSIHLC